MAPIRLRHPKGVSTIQIPFDRDDFTVLDLQQEIYAASDILPPRQILKSGYPPRSMTLIPELPLSSLGLQSGEQIIVNENSEPDHHQPFSTPQSNISSTTPARGAPASSGSALSSHPSVPVRPPSPRPIQQDSNTPDHVRTDAGFLVHRIVPDDNSCLFSAVALVFEQDISKAQQLRQIVADGIRSDPEKYNEAILGMPPSRYITTILKPSAWGGAIELGILASYYHTEIASIDVETSRIDHFIPGETTAAGGLRCLLIYSGIHYDTATLAPMIDAPSEWHQTLFPVTSSDDDSDAVLVAAKRLAGLLRAKKAYTNTATFDLKCADCGEGLKGEKGARAHAEQTGHVRFGEY